MKRRYFITAASLSVPFALTGITGCRKSGHSEIPATSDNPSTDPLLEKALQAMLCMQRMAWEQGTASQALIEAGREDLAIMFAKDAIVRQTIEGRLGIIGNDPGITDPASNGESVVLLSKKTGSKFYQEAADKMYQYLKQTAPKSPDEILYHLNDRNQIWSDSSFMAPPFLALMGDYDEAMKQMKGFKKYLFDPDKKLLHHMWDEDKKQYAREAFWGGGNGWTVAGIAKIIRILPENRNDIRTALAEYGKELLDGCLKYMRPDGLFHDVIDDPDTFVETNLSQMLAFGIYSGIQSGWLDYDYREKADKMRQGARQMIDPNGIVQGACGSPHFDKPGTSVEAQAFFLFMEYALQSLETAKLKTRES